MHKGKSILFILFLVVSKLLAAQDPEAIQEYISTYKDLAIEEMLRTGVPASIKLAQGIHETEAGQSELVLKSNNHFGIKCKNTWTGESVRHDDDARGECFRKYDNPEDSYRDHSDFLKNSQRYSSLFRIDPTDYASWAWGLKKAGYATNPKYPQILIKLIEQYNLNDYTLIALGKLKDEQGDIASGKKARSYSSPVDIDENGNEVDNKIKAQVKEYPEGLFRINDTKVIFAKKGTSFLNIAEKYDIPFARLFEFNDMPEKDIVDEDQLVFLQRKKRTGNNQFHIVQAGEKLFDIAQSEAIRLENLMVLNLLSEGQEPATGEKLFLHSKAPSTPRLTLKTDNNSYDNRSVINNQ